MPVRHFTSCLLLLFILISLIVLLDSIAKPDVLPIGSVIPRIVYKDRAGFSVLKSTPGIPVLVLSFHLQCKYCHMLLHEMNQNIHKFGQLQLVLFSPTVSFQELPELPDWPELRQAPNVLYGIVHKKQFKDRFGTSVSPALFLFDDRGILRNKIKGEIGIDRLLGMLDDLGIPQ
jgi:hypothetical protein